MWIFIWLILSVFVLGVFGWSYIVLQQQKAAWKTFAQKNSLSYRPGKLLESPQISGRIDGATITFSSGAQITPDVRGERFVTVIEIDMGPGMPTAGAIATKEYADFLSTLRLDETVTPEGTEWSADYIVKTKSRQILSSWLTQERAKLIHAVFSMKNSQALVFFDDQDFALRVETADPLRNPEKMDKITKWLISAAKQLYTGVEK